MATTTPNFGWPVPTSTDLVKDGATAIEALGDSIDASLLDLKGGTTGQVLSKNSATDMDFIWVTDAAGDITGVTAGTGISGGGTSGTVTVTNSMATAIDAKGDLVAGTAADTFSRLAVGADGTVLTADSAEATGLKWATAASGGMTLLSTTSLTGSSTTVSSISGSYKNLQIVMRDFKVASDFGFLIEFNSDATGSNYFQYVSRAAAPSTLAPYGDNGTAGMDMTGSAMVANQNDTFAVLNIYDYASAATYKTAQSVAVSLNTSSAKAVCFNSTSYFSTTAISSLKFKTTVGTWTAGTILIYGVN
jgi:hypothetical protein